MTTQALPLSSIVLRDGTKAFLREVTAADAGDIRALYEGMSAESFYLRFFSNSRFSIDEEVARLVRKAPETHEALVATVDGKVIAVGCYEVLADPSKAEIAVAIDDTHHALGVSKGLIDQLAEVASSRKIDQFVIETLRVGDPMVEVLRNLGLAFHVTQWGPGALLFELTLAKK